MLGTWVILGNSAIMLSSVRKPPPQVTGISPKEGPPGTKVTIRGENLGVDARDIIGKNLIIISFNYFLLYCDRLMKRPHLSSCLHSHSLYVATFTKGCCVMFNNFCSMDPLLFATYCGNEHT